MRLSYIFLLIAVLLPPAIAADEQSGKQEVEKIAAAFTESYKKQNSAGIADLFTKDGVLVNQTGPHTDIAQFYEGAFKAGIDHIDITVNEVTKLGVLSETGTRESVLGFFAAEWLLKCLRTHTSVAKEGF